jgi:hypothetical protein
LELQDFVVISENGRVFLQNFQQGRGSERHVCREMRRAKETSAVFHFSDLYVVFNK